MARIVASEQQVVVPQIQPAQVDQLKSLSQRSSSHSIQAPTRYGQWADSSQLNDDAISPYGDGDVLIMEEGEPSSYQEASASKEKHDRVDCSNGDRDVITKQ